jgi:DNA-binding CsgD family transcriptional regulator
MAMESIDYAAIIADLEAKRTALDATITAFRAAQAAGALGISGGDSTGGMADGFSAALLPTGDVPVGAFLGKSIPEAAKLCLQIVKRKLTSREIAEYLKKGGIESSARNFPGLVHSILIRASRAGNGIVKLDRSNWALGGWYPASMRTAGASEKRPYKRRKQRKPESKTQPPEVKPEEAKPTDGLKPKERIVKALRSQPGQEMSVQELADHLGMKKPIVSMVLGKLIQKNSIQKTVSGKYRLAA